MGLDPFDRWSRTVASTMARRQSILALLLGILGSTRETREIAAGLGCKDVGAKCKKAKQCCCGVCQGKRGSKRCRAHDTGDCPAGPFTCESNVSCTTNTGFVGECLPTRGNAVYCASTQQCANCAADRDCRGTHGASAACVACTDECPETNGRKCVGNLGD